MQNGPRQQQPVLQHLGAGIAQIKYPADADAMTGNSIWQYLEHGLVGKRSVWANAVSAKALLHDKHV